jgi:hypothetical protein
MRALIYRTMCILTFAFSAMLPAHAATVLLDNTIISFSASGSPNTIAGWWSSSPLIIGEGEAIDYFTIELTEIISDFGRPVGISFVSYIPGNARSLSFCFNTSSCVADTIVGDMAVIGSGSTVLWAWDFLNRLVDENSPQINSGNSIVAYSSGGGTANISGQVLVQVYGEAAAVAVPIPPTVYLFGAGLVALMGMTGRRKNTIRCFD